MKIIYTAFFILINTLSIGLNAQNSASVYLDEVKKGIEHIYNQEFTSAEQVIDRLDRRLQGSAIPDLMRALNLYWRHYPLYLKEEKLEQFQQYLDKSYQRSLKVLESDPGNPEATFLAMASQGLLAESYSESGKSLKAVGAAKRAYNYIKTGSNKLDQYKEFYLSTGLYNYYREYYPETYPIYKPFMSFFMKGDKQLGIKQLEVAAKQASITHVIAKYYLSYIYMRYEYIPAKALRQGKDLHSSYPRNPLFSAIYLESLIINDRFKEAQPIAAKLQQHSSPYLRIYGDLFMAVVEEKYHQNYQKAEQLYRLALQLDDEHDMERDHLQAFAYMGLGRIYEKKQDPEARKYFKEALDQAYTKAMKDEAKTHLN